MAGPSWTKSGPSVEELEEATEEQEEALKEEDKAMEREGELKEKEEELSKQGDAQKTPDRETKRIRANASGSSSPPCQPPPPGPVTPIHKLPDDVLQKIFEPLNLETIVNVISVCSRWQGVVEDRSLIKNLRFWSSTFSTEEALALIRSAPNLKSLELFQRSDTVDLLYAATARCRNLLHLSLDFGYTSVSVTDALRKVFDTNPHISHLHLRNVDIFPRLQFCQELGALLPDLRKLEFKIDLSDLELDALFEGCSRNQLEELKLWFGSWPGKHIAKLVHFWGRSLRALELDAFNLTEGEWAQLGGFSELRRLRLVGLNTRSDWLSGLAAVPHLEDLDIIFTCEVQPEKLCRFFSLSNSSQGLRKLSLIGGWGVDHSVLASVAAFCPQLEELDVGGMYRITSGVREVLRCCHNLHYLCIEYPKGNVLQIVAELPQLAPQLRIIRLGSKARRRLDEDTLRSVRAQMPHLRIE